MIRIIVLLLLVISTVFQPFWERDCSAQGLICSENKEKNEKTGEVVEEVEFIITQAKKVIQIKYSQSLNKVLTQEIAIPKETLSNIYSKQKLFIRYRSIII